MEPQKAVMSYNVSMWKIASLSSLFLVAASILSLSGAEVAQAQCLDLSSDMSYGMTDTGSNGPVSLLQQYLSGAGYLTAAPNGHFGPATLAAVKAYQVSNAIPNTGYVGPMTRASLQSKTCQAQTVPSAPVTVSNPPTSVTSSQAPANDAPVTFGITSPATGQAFNIGSSTVISWSSQPSDPFNISLEQPNGGGGGFVAYNLNPSTSGSRYVWKVGTTYSSGSNVDVTIQPGTYRLRLQSVIHGAQQGDQVSGWFTILAKKFGVSQVMPSSAYADDASPVVLFGSGLSMGTQIYFGSNYSSLRANDAYASADGSVLVFTVPSSVPPGSYTLYVDGDQNTSPATVAFTVNSI